MSLAFRPLDFIQVNAALNEKMIAHTFGLLDLQAQDRVLDLFCGLGNFTLPMARLVGLSRLSIRLVATRYAVAALVGTAICWEI